MALSTFLKNMKCSIQPSPHNFFSSPPLSPPICRFSSNSLHPCAPFSRSNRGLWCIPLHLPSSCKPTLGTCTSSSRLELIFHLDSCHFATCCSWIVSYLSKERRCNSSPQAPATHSPTTRCFHPGTSQATSCPRVSHHPLSTPLHKSRKSLNLLRGRFALPTLPSSMTSFRSRTTSMSSCDPLRTS